MGSSKSFILLTIFLVAYIAIVFATNQTTGNNVCDISKKDLFNGTQNPDGECVTTVMGEVPSKNQMVSTIIRFPKDGDVIMENTTFTVRTVSQNLDAGFFDDPAAQYYLFPQTLNDDGLIQGHSHVTIQKIIDEDQPLDPTIFAFFKGLNDGPDANGELSVNVTNGLPAGKYRVCTMVASFAHQPTLMPIAQRGSQDDCTRFLVKPKY